MLSWVLTAAIFAALIYWYFQRKLKYWIERGVPQGNPTVFFGDNLGTCFKTQSMTDMVRMVYNYGGKNARYAGCYQFLLPTLIVKDTELIRQITIKDFDHFVDHRSFVPEDVDPLWGRNLFSLTGKKWRDMRQTLSPAFTSSKMKYMFSLITKSAEQYVEYYLNQNKDLVTVEMKDSLGRFTTDVIANAAFGVECDSLKDSDNEFYVRGKEATNFSGLRMIKFFGYFVMPEVFKFFKISLFPQSLTDFFIRVVKSNIESREKHGIVRPDMIHIMLEARKNGIKHEETQPEQDTGFATVEEAEIHKTNNKKAIITDNDITSQALIFFFAGFDAVSNLMSFLSYELGVHQDVQQRLIEEVDETYKACNGNITYEALLGMKYMDMVVCECLRKWPNAIIMDRVCTKPYTIEPKLTHEKPLHLNRGDVLWIPLVGLQRDEKYWPNPDQFDPERFSEENRNKIVPYSYIPFGSGPRNCIGSRFALLETKALIFYILTNFQIVPVEKTVIPMRLSKKQFNMTAEDGFWFGLKRRVKN